MLDAIGSVATTMQQGCDDIGNLSMSSVLRELILELSSDHISTATQSEPVTSIATGEIDGTLAWGNNAHLETILGNT